MAVGYMTKFVGKDVNTNVKLFSTVHKTHLMIDMSDVVSMSYEKREKEPHWEGFGFGTLIQFKSGGELFIPHKGTEFALSEHNKIIKGLSDSYK